MIWNWFYILFYYVLQSAFMCLVGKFKGHSEGYQSFDPPVDFWLTSKLYTVSLMRKLYLCFINYNEGFVTLSLTKGVFFGFWVFHTGL